MKLRWRDAAVVLVLAPALLFVAILAWGLRSPSPLSVNDDPLT